MTLQFFFLPPRLRKLRFSLARPVRARTTKNTASMKTHLLNKTMIDPKAWSRTFGAAITIFFFLGTAIFWGEKTSDVFSVMSQSPLRVNSTVDQFSWGMRVHGGHLSLTISTLHGESNLSSQKEDLNFPSSQKIPFALFQFAMTNETTGPPLWVNTPLNSP